MVYLIPNVLIECIYIYMYIYTAYNNNRLIAVEIHYIIQWVLSLLICEMFSNVMKRIE